MNEVVLSVLKSHFGDDVVIEESSHIIDDLGGDDFDIVDIVVQIEEKLGISIPAVSYTHLTLPTNREV